MLGTENVIAIEHVVNEILKSNISTLDKIDLLYRLKKYEGFNDDFTFIDVKILELRGGQ